MNRDKMYIASCSFGKDSIATILLALENNEPLDRAVFAEVMFDHSRGISGEIPEHIEWIYSTAIPKLESMGVKIDVVKAEKDYLQLFHRILTKGKWKGKKEGFPMGGKCIINCTCKVSPMHNYLKSFSDYDITQYIGIAIDEKPRLERLHRGYTSGGGYTKISLLEKYGYTEKMALEMCRDYDLLSPLYAFGARGGCWFCPNMRIPDIRRFRKEHSPLWYELVELGKTPNLCKQGYKYCIPIEDIEKRFAGEDLQLSLF